MRTVTRITTTLFAAVALGAGITPAAGAADTAAIPDRACCVHQQPWDDPNNDNYFKTVCDRAWVPDHGYHRVGKRLNGHFETTNCRRVRREGVPIG